jgi:hypothetical protein
MAPDQYALIFALLMFAGFAAAGIWSTIEWRKKEQRRITAERGEDGVRLALARKHGWRYAYTPNDDAKYQFSGKTATGHEWTLRFDLDARSSAPSPKLIFLANGPATESITLLIGSTQAYDALRSSTGRKTLSVARTLLDKLSSGRLGQMADFYDNAVVETHGIWSMATRGLAPTQVQRLKPLLEKLSQWPREVSRHRKDDIAARFELTQDPQGLVITLQGDQPSVATIEIVAALGLGAMAALS